MLEIRLRIPGMKTMVPTPDMAPCEVGTDFITADKKLHERIGQ